MCVHFCCDRIIDMDKNKVSNINKRIFELANCKTGYTIRHIRVVLEYEGYTKIPSLGKMSMLVGKDIRNKSKQENK